MSKEKKLQIRNSTAEFLVFTRQTGEEGIEVRVAEETVWLTQKLMARLFEVTVPTINEHLGNLFEQGEISRQATIRNFRTVQTEGNREVSRDREFYNLDAIIAVGFRVNSARAIQFRQWATGVLRDFAIHITGIRKEQPMKTHPLMRLLCALAALFTLSAVARPNIVLLFIDDMGYGDIAPFGSKLNRTPNLDRMAREGMKLTSFYAAPVCSVSRAQVITGCYGARVSIPGVFGPGSKNGINAAEHTVAELLKAQGYATFCIGKWHLGDQPEFLPTRHGFDHYFGLPYSNDMDRKSVKDGRSVVPLMRDDQVSELLDGDAQNQLTERYTDEALKFIRDHREKPFFLYLPHTAVHVPIHPGDKFRGKSANGRFGDWVEEVDWSVGRVLDTLRELKLDANTLVIFTSDNGPWLVQGKDGGTAGPLRGGKGSTWEGGSREPTIAWWPGKIAPGSVCDAIAGTIDFLPTFVGLAGGAVPTDRKIDGHDILPLLLGKTKESPHEARYYYRGYKLEAIRSGPWKLALGPQSEGMGIGGIALDAQAAGVRLYNLDVEIGERTDVAAQHPDVVRRLQALAATMAADIGDGKPGPGVRAAGLVENPTMLYPASEPARRDAAKKNAKKNK